MLEVIHAPTGKTYTARQFSRLPDSDLAVMRKEIVCRLCGNKAKYYRKGSGGASEHFGATHVPGCKDTSGTKIEKVPATDEIIVDQIHNSGKIMVVDRMPLRIKTGKTGVLIVDSEEDDTLKQRTKNTHSGTIRETDKRHGILSRFIESLADGRDMHAFADQFQVSGELTLPPEKMFVHFDDAIEEHVDKFRIYWGYIVEVRTVGSTVYLNSGYTRGTIGVRLTANDLSEIMNRNRQMDVQGFRGQAVIAQGRLRLRKGSRYIEVRDFRDVATTEIKRTSSRKA